MIFKQNSLYTNVMEIFMTRTLNKLKYSMAYL